MLDPGAYGRRIGRVDGTCYLARVICPPVLVHLDGRMEAEHGARGDTDPVARNRAEDKRAGRQARPINDDPLARVANFRKEVEIVDDRSAHARHDVHIGKRRDHADDGQDDSEDAAPHGDLPISSAYLDWLSQFRFVLCIILAF